MARLALCAVAVALALAACSAGDIEPGPDSYVTDAAVDPDRMRVEPETSRPGDDARIEFRAGEGRLRVFVVERVVRSRWVWEWALFSDLERPVALLSADEIRDQGGLSYPDGPLWVGAEPHPFPIPEGMPGGDYRVCTVSGNEPELCAEFSVSG